MKDIKQYFADGSKSDEEGLDTICIGTRTEQRKSILTNGKRKRVKIRISRVNSKERVCDILESKNDSIEKTPSPFAKLNNEEKVSQDGTPRSCVITSGTRRDLKKDTWIKMDRSKSKKSNTSQNLLEKSKVNKRELSNEVIMDSDSSNDNINTIDKSGILSTKLHNIIDSQREESNAFQVLMNRNKPIQYKSLMGEPMEDIENSEKLQTVKEVKSKHKEKLTALADKKGYTKHKLAEAEEGLIIKKNIEDRMKYYRSDIKKEDSIGLSVKNNKQLSGNLLNYFSTSSLAETSKDVKYTSTFTVKADVHNTDTASIEPVLKSIPNKVCSNKKQSKSDVPFSKMDDIHFIAPHELTLSQNAKHDKQLQEKPRWSLRIKLQSSENNELLNDTSDEELFSPRSKLKLNAAMNKSRKSVSRYIEEDNKVYLKDYDTRVKIKDPSKEKICLTSKQKTDNVSNSVKNIIFNSNNENFNASLNKPNKLEQKVNGITKTAVIIDNDSDCEVTSENILKRKKSNEKLAPLFTKRRKTNPVAAAAKRLFLQSDIIEIQHKHTDRKINTNIIPILPFPAISHVMQLETKSYLNRSETKYKFPLKADIKYMPTVNINDYTCITNYKDTPKVIETIGEPVKENIDQILSEVEERCPDVYDIWKTVSRIKGELKKKSSPRLRSRKAKMLEKKEALKENIKNEESQTHECVWICKYKPMCAQEVVGNEEAAKKLKDWLSSWRTCLSKDEDNSSSDEFYSSNCNTSYRNENEQTAVLLGPYGSGKSASVYAVAEELGYSVLEVNASSRRTGKRILKELEEATKSHRVKKNERKSPFERVAKENETSKISQNSLILLEDIDLIFEEDEGFISAAYQLASNTKRPIVMTSRGMCPHLSKMAPQQNKIYFQKVNGSRVSAFLELISLAEAGYRLPHTYLMKLLQTGDLRKALLQLQYLLLSGPPILSEEYTRLSLWRDIQHYLYKPAIKLNKRNKTKKNASTKHINKAVVENTVGILENLTNDLDGLSLMSSLINIDDMALNVSETSLQPNLSLAENMSMYSASRYLSLDIANFLSDRIMYKKLHKQPIQNENCILKKQLNQGVDLALSHVTPMCLDRQIVAVDYLSTARAICRAEELRSTANYKRGNRFFHYLHSLKVPTALLKPNILSAACKMLQDVNKNKSINIVNVISD